MKTQWNSKVVTIKNDGVMIAIRDQHGNVVNRKAEFMTAVRTSLQSKGYVFEGKRVSYSERTGSQIVEETYAKHIVGYSA